MYVKDKMSKNLCTVTADTIISEALEKMQANNFHRIPVIDKDNHLVGLLTEGLINKDNNNSSLSVYELNYLLNKLKVKDVMRKKEDVLTIGEDVLLEEAAVLLREKQVGCLPVIGDDEKVVGIITHYDIFDAFIDILGYNKVGTRYVILVNEDKVGIMHNISKCFVEANISINNIAVYHTERGIEVVVIASGENSGNCGDYLKKAGYNVTSINKVGC